MVSKGYLRAWADEKERVDVIDVHDGRGFPTTISKATVVTYAYDPDVMTHDLEEEYARIESAGIPALRKLHDHQSITPAEQTSVIAFLQMHLERGLYADQNKILTPAVLIKTGGLVEQADLNLGDRLVLSRLHQERLDLTALALENWQWQVVSAKHLATGDGAVLRWKPTPGGGFSTVSFPLSPTQLLVIGDDIPESAPLNTMLAKNCRRWILGAPGSLNWPQAQVIAAERSQLSDRAAQASERQG